MYSYFAFLFSFLFNDNLRLIHLITNSTYSQRFNYLLANMALRLSDFFQSVCPQSLPLYIYVDDYASRLIPQHGITRRGVSTTLKAISVLLCSVPKVFKSRTSLKHPLIPNCFLSKQNEPFVKCKFYDINSKT